MGILVEPAAAADGPPGPGLHTFEFNVDGLRRSYIVHVPAGRDPQAPRPVVVMLHGGGGTAKAAVYETGWTDKAEKEGPGPHLGRGQEPPAGEHGGPYIG